MEYLLIWAFFCLLVAAVGNERTIGFWPAFLISFFLSPVVGFIVCLLYPSVSSRNKAQEEQRKQTELLKNISGAKQLTISEELDHLKRQLDSGIISPEEFELLKSAAIKRNTA